MSPCGSLALILLALALVFLGKALHANITVCATKSDWQFPAIVFADANGYFGNAFTIGCRLQKYLFPARNGHHASELRRSLSRVMQSNFETESHSAGRLIEPLRIVRRHRQSAHLPMLANTHESQLLHFFAFTSATARLSVRRATLTRLLRSRCATETGVSISQKNRLPRLTILIAPPQKSPQFYAIS